MAIFWVIKSIRYAYLEYEKFDIWNIRLDCKSDIE